MTKKIFLDLLDRERRELQIKKYKVHQNPRQALVEIIKLMKDARATLINCLMTTKMWIKVNNWKILGP